MRDDYEWAKPISLCIKENCRLVDMAEKAQLDFTKGLNWDKWDKLSREERAKIKMTGDVLEKRIEILDLIIKEKRPIGFVDKYGYEEASAMGFSGVSVRLCFKNLRREGTVLYGDFYINPNRVFDVTKLAKDLKGKEIFVHHHRSFFFSYLAPANGDSSPFNFEFTDMICKG